MVVWNSGCTSVIFQPQKKHYLDLKQFNVNYEDVYFKSEPSVQLHGWWLPKRTEKDKGSIVFLHGNAGNISSHIANAYWLTKHGFNVFLFDYRGYGYSQGEPMLPGIFSDINAALDYVYQRNSNNKVIVIGQSLGASLGVYAMSQPENRDKLKAYLMISGFSDYQEITQDLLSSWWLTWVLQWPLSKTINNDYRPLSYIADIAPVPLVLFHSRDDGIIPFYHAEKLFQQAAHPKRLVELRGSHNRLFTVDDNRLKVLEQLMVIIGYDDSTGKN